MIKAGAVAKDGIAKKIGEKNSATRNKSATITPGKPERPPSEIPMELSTKVVTVDVPKQAPIVVPIASARSAPLMRGNLPSLSM